MYKRCAVLSVPLDIRNLLLRCVPLLRDHPVYYTSILLYVTSRCILLLLYFYYYIIMCLFIKYIAIYYISKNFIECPNFHERQLRGRRPSGRLDLSAFDHVFYFQLESLIFQFFYVVGEFVVSVDRICC